MKKRILAASFVLAMFLGVGFSLMADKSNAAMEELYYYEEYYNTCSCPGYGTDCVILDDLVL